MSFEGLILNQQMYVVDYFWRELRIKLRRRTTLNFKDICCSLYFFIIVLISYYFDFFSTNCRNDFGVDLKFRVDTWYGVDNFREKWDYI
jgi:hypothetical protein